MVSLKFSFGRVQKTTKGRIAATVIYNRAEGLIKIIEGEYKVEYNNKLYPISEDSYESKGKKVVYSTKLDKYNHRVKIIRDADNKSALNKQHYIPFAVGLIAKGRIIKPAFGKEQFHIVSCYAANDYDGIADAFNEWKEYEENLNKKEDDEFSSD